MLEVISIPDFSHVHTLKSLSSSLSSSASLSSASSSSLSSSSSSSPPTSLSQLSYDRDDDDDDGFLVVFPVPCSLPSPPSTIGLLIRILGGGAHGGGRGGDDDDDNYKITRLIIITYQDDNDDDDKISSPSRATSPTVVHDPLNKQMSLAKKIMYFHSALPPMILFFNDIV